MGGYLIPADWDGESFCCYVIEWPLSQQWEAILFGLITGPLRGRFWDGSSGSITDAQAVGQEIYSLNFAEVCAMTCLEDLSASLAQINSSILATGGGNGCNGAAGADLYEAPASTFQDLGNNFPTGYADRAEYVSYKCDLALRLITMIVNDLNNLKILNLTGLTASGVLFGLGVGLIISVATPLVFLLAIVATMLLIFAADGTLVDAMDEAIAYLEAFDLCLIFSCQTTEEAQTVIYASIDAQVWTSSLTPVLLKNWFSYDSLNPMFDPKPPFESLPTADCSGCGPACVVQYLFGSGVEGWTWVDDSTGSSTAVGSWDAVSLALDNQITVANEPNVTGEVEWTGPLVSGNLLANTGDTVIVNTGPPSDSLAYQVTIVLTYTDMTNSQASSVPIIAATTTLVVPGGVSDKPIDRVEVLIARSTSGSANGSTFNVDILDVTLNLANPTNCP